MPHSPGTYLRTCRNAAGLGLRQAAANLATLPWAVVRVGPAEIRALQHRLVAAEEDRLSLTRAQAELVANAFPFDAETYLSMVAASSNPAAEVVAA